MSECMHTACDNERLLFESYCQSHLLPERASQDALPIFKETPDTQPPVKSEEELRERIVNLVADDFACTRVWSAWDYGTMTRDDFEQLSETERVDEILQLITTYGDQRELEGRTKELETFAVPVEERRRADSFYGSIYVTEISRIDERIDELEAKQQEGK